MTNIVSTRCEASTRMAWIDRPLVCLTTEAAAHWRSWLSTHGLDAEVICLDQPIVCDDNECTISLQVWQETTAAPVRQEVTYQFATPALPFPEVTGYATWAVAPDELEEEDAEYLDEESVDEDVEFLVAA